MQFSQFMERVALPHLELITALLRGCAFISPCSSFKCIPNSKYYTIQNSHSFAHHHCHAGALGSVILSPHISELKPPHKAL